LLCTGDELLNGATLNTHARALGEAFKQMGVTLTRETSIRDDRETMAKFIAEAIGRVDVLVISGGLGPTRDDVTREAVAQALGRELVVHRAFERILAKRYESVGRAFTEDRRRQAVLVEDAKLIRNPVGSAPGQRIQTEGATIYLLPGPPREFNGILEDSLLEEWQSQVETRVHEQLHMIAGIGESEVERALEGVTFADGTILGFRASPFGLELRLTSEQPDDLEAGSAILYDVFGDAIYADQRKTLPEAVTELLLKRRATVATAESCTGGLVAKFLTDQAGSSAYFLGSIVAYHNEVKERLLGVPAEIFPVHGAVSAPCAEAMAAGAKERLGSDYALSLTGIAGPGGGTDTKPVGLVFIGLATPDGVQSQEFRLPGNRDLVRTFAAMRAFDMLRKALK